MADTDTVSRTSPRYRSVHAVAIRMKRATAAPENGTVPDFAHHVAFYIRRT
jgi:hypothetical protein